MPDFDIFQYDLGASSFQLKNNSLASLYANMPIPGALQSPSLTPFDISEYTDPNSMVNFYQKQLQESIRNIHNFKKPDFVRERRKQNKVPLTSEQYKTIGVGLETIGDAVDMLGGGSGTQNSAGTIGLNAAGEQIAKVLPGKAGMWTQAGIALNKIANNTYNKIDEYNGQSAATQIFGSNILGFTGANRWGSKRMDTYALDDAIKSQSQFSYTGALDDISKAEDLSGKRIGTFDVKSKSKQFNKGKEYGNRLTDIISDAQNRFSIANSMSSYNKRLFDMQNGYDQAAIRVGRHGLSLKNIVTAKRVVSTLKFQPKLVKQPQLKVVDHFQQGGTLELSSQDISGEYLQPLSTIKEVALDSILPEFKEGGSIQQPSNTIKEVSLTNIPEEYLETVTKYAGGGPVDDNKKEESYEWTIDYAKSKNLNWIRRWLDPNRVTIPDWKVKGQVATHKLSRDSGDFDGKTLFVVYPKVQEIDGQLYDFTDPKNKRDEFDAYYSALDNKEALIFEDENAADWFVKHYKEYAPSFNKYKEGGSFNVIPEGALHARLHHMENADNLTKKGIPVVAEGQDGKLEQQCEIEREEIIFRLEVTKKLEELAKEGSDEAAIEAGKLLVDEILYNTIDNTNTLL